MIDFAPTRWISVKRITKAPYNPRKSLHPDSRVGKQLRSSLDAYGCVQTLVWNERTGHLVAGNQRFDVMLASGVQRVRVSVVDLPLDREKQLNIALNAIDGEWDEGALADVLAEITSGDSFDAESIGFSSSEIDRLLADQQTADVVTAEDDAAAAEPGPARVEVTQPGEIIELGEHRLACGDCTDGELLGRLLGDTKAHLLFTDPPYNVAYNAADRPSGASAADSRPIANDKMTESEYRAFTEAWLAHAKDRLVPGGGFYIWNGFANFGMLAEVLASMKLAPKHVITWAKESFSPGFGDYNEQTEFCLYGRKAGGRRRWHGPKNESTLWSIPRDRTLLYRHPTQKALPLAERAIRNSSARAETVLDPFLGSGTTLVAAARLGRRCVGTEVDPLYCDVIVRRFIAAAGRAAVSDDIADRYLTAEKEDTINAP